MYVQCICNFPTHPLNQQLYRLIMRICIFRHDKTFYGAPVVQTPERGGSYNIGITSINGPLTTEGGGDREWRVHWPLLLQGVGVVTTSGEWSESGDRERESGGNSQKWLIILCNGLSIFVDDVLGGNFRNIGVGRKTRHLHGTSYMLKVKY